jgi:hypothetical protein
MIEHKDDENFEHCFTKSKLLELFHSLYLHGIKHRMKLEADAHRNNTLFQNKDLTFDGWLTKENPFNK